MNELFSDRARRLLADLDSDRLIVERRARLQKQMRAAGVSACLFFLPANIRYATGVSVMDVHCLAASERYCVIAAEGKPILFEWQPAIDRSNKIIEDVRPALWWQYQGAHGKQLISAFVGETLAALTELAVEPGAPVAVDRIDPSAVFALQSAGLNLVSASPVTDAAREIKTQDEVTLMRVNGEIGRDMLLEFEEAIVPGVREIDLLAVLSNALIRRDGITLFTRLVSSGQNSNPWGTEASNRKGETGDLVALDSDATGYEGYVIDVSRTFLCGDQAPSEEQRRLYRLAMEQLMAMREATRAGRSYAAFSKLVPPLPEDYRPQSYECIVHGAGLMNEGPVIYQPWDENNPHDKVLEENMVLCLEAYVGRVGGSCGVKLEDQVLVTKDGHELLVDYPFDQRLGH